MSINRMSINGLLLDLAGVVYDGNTIIPGALDATAKLRDAGLKIRFVTNTTRKSNSQLLTDLQAKGILLQPDELFTPVQAARRWLTDNARTPRLLVHPALSDAFADLPTTPSEAVVIGDAVNGFTYANMNDAFRRLIDGAELVALAKNRVFKDSDGLLSLDTGAFVTALEFASGKEAVVLGKPSKEFFAQALASMGCEPANTVMIGDDAEADVAGALSAGLASAILVRTGKYQNGDEMKCDPAPTATVADLTAAVAWIIDNR